MSDNAFEDFRLFPPISEAWELMRSGLVIIKEELYKLELWHSYTNPDIPYYVLFLSRRMTHGQECPTRRLPRVAMAIRRYATPWPS
jgi:hypothetical protein